ncbi:unnamed protein product [Dicrocoelium dendriticum]|nr:unnamed protein product [Dicrocoelium dendriticum]
MSSLRIRLPSAQSRDAKRAPSGLSVDSSDGSLSTKQYAKENDSKHSDRPRSGSSGSSTSASFPIKRSGLASSRPCSSAQFDPLENDGKQSLVGSSTENVVSGTPSPHTVTMPPAKKKRSHKRKSAVRSDPDSSKRLKSTPQEGSNRRLHAEIHCNSYASDDSVHDSDHGVSSGSSGRRVNPEQIGGRSSLVSYHNSEDSHSPEEQRADSCLQPDKSPVPRKRTSSLPHTRNPHIDQPTAHPRSLPPDNADAPHKLTSNHFKVIKTTSKSTWDSSDSEFETSTAPTKLPEAGTKDAVLENVKPTEPSAPVSESKKKKKKKSSHTGRHEARNKENDEKPVLPTTKTSKGTSLTRPSNKSSNKHPRTEQHKSKRSHRGRERSYYSHASSRSRTHSPREVDLPSTNRIDLSGDKHKLSRSGGSFSSHSSRHGSEYSSVSSRSSDWRRRSCYRRHHHRRRHSDSYSSRSSSRDSSNVSARGHRGRSSKSSSAHDRARRRRSRSTHRRRYHRRSYSSRSRSRSWRSSTSTSRTSYRSSRSVSRGSSRELSRRSSSVRRSSSRHSPASCQKATLHSKPLGGETLIGRSTKTTPSSHARSQFSESRTSDTLKSAFSLSDMAETVSAAVKRVTGGHNANKSTKHSDNPGFPCISLKTSTSTDGVNSSSASVLVDIPLPKDSRHHEDYIHGLDELPVRSEPTPYIGPQLPPDLAKRFGLSVGNNQSGSCEVSSDGTSSNPQGSSVEGTTQMSTDHLSSNTQQSNSLEFLIPPEKVEQYRALQEQAKQHALRRHTMLVGSGSTESPVTQLTSVQPGTYPQQLAILHHLQRDPFLGSTGLVHPAYSTNLALLSHLNASASGAHPDGWLVHPTQENSEDARLKSLATPFGGSQIDIFNAQMAHLLGLTTGLPSASAAPKTSTVDATSLPAYLSASLQQQQQQQLQHAQLQQLLSATATQSGGNSLTAQSQNNIAAQLLQHLANQQSQQKLPVGNSSNQISLPVLAAYLQQQKLQAQLHRQNLDTLQNGAFDERFAAAISGAGDPSGTMTNPVSMVASVGTLNNPTITWPANLVRNRASNPTVSAISLPTSTSALSPHASLAAALAAAQQQQLLMSALRQTGAQQPTALIHQLNPSFNASSTILPAQFKALTPHQQQALLVQALQLKQLQQQQLQQQQQRFLSPVATEQSLLQAQLAAIIQQRQQQFTQAQLQHHHQQAVAASAIAAAQAQRQQQQQQQTQDVLGK